MSRPPLCDDVRGSFGTASGEKRKKKGEKNVIAEGTIATVSFAVALAVLILVILPRNRFLAGMGITGMGFGLIITATAAGDPTTSYSPIVTVIACGFVVMLWGALEYFGIKGKK